MTGDGPPCPAPATLLPVSRDAYEAMIDGLGSPALGEAVLCAAEQILDVDEVFGFWVGDGRDRELIISAGRVGSSTARATLYAERFGRFDPLAEFLTRRVTGCAMRSARLSPAQITNADYRHECYDDPGFCERLSFVRYGEDRNLVLSLYRRRLHGTVDPDRLAAFAEAIFPVLKRHASLLGDEKGLDPTARIARRLASRYPALSPREREVCACSIVGMTAEAIALELGIGPASVITYRRRAYQRYGLSSSGEMIGNLLS